MKNRSLVLVETLPNTRLLPFLLCPSYVSFTSQSYLPCFRDVQAFHATVTAWMVEMECNLARGKTRFEDLRSHSMSFIQVENSCYSALLFISYKFVKGFLAITVLLLLLPSWNFHDVCQRFLYNQERNFSLIRLKMRNFPIDPHYKNCPLLV